MKNTVLKMQLNSEDNHQLAKTIQLIYAGGTFGSYGTPLAPLSSDVLLPNLLAHLEELNIKGIEVTHNDCIKDSSQLSPSDFVHFYQIIFKKYIEGERQFVLITGTDTLSYLGAFLAECFSGSDVCIALTASMQPFFASKNINSKFDNSLIHNNYHIDNNSDAWGNLNQCINIARNRQSGIFTCLSGNTWHSQTVQKINSHALLAFTGEALTHDNTSTNSHHKLNSSYQDYLCQQDKQAWLAKQQSWLTSISDVAKQVNIPVVYSVPTDAENITKQIKSLLSHSKPTGLIILGFGAGNIPYCDSLAAAFKTATQRGHIIIATTQCPFGGVSNAYASGSWQYQYGVLSGNTMTVPAIYARLLWLILTIPIHQRHNQWQAMVHS